MNEEIVRALLRIKWAIGDNVLTDFCLVRDLLRELLFAGDQYAGECTLLLALMDEGLPVRMQKGCLDDEAALNAEARHIARIYHMEEDVIRKGLLVWRYVAQADVAKASSGQVDARLLQALSDSATGPEVGETLLDPPMNMPPVTAFSAPSGKVWTNSIGMEFVKIPAGSFWMGSGKDDEDASDLEKPRHKVTISRPFYLGRYPVTQTQWEAVMGNNPSSFKGTKRPVECVSWDDAQEFIFKLNAREGHNRYRLPTEAEWEYACRAGSKGRYCFGDDESKVSEYVCCYEGARDETYPVGQRKPNAWALYDMHGNVKEWCSDLLDNYSAGAVVDPQGPEAPTEEGGKNYMLRGGSWYYVAAFCRSASRDFLGHFACKYDIGFRLALSPGD